jgi:hypothetical protein
VRDQVLHPYKTTVRKIIEEIIYIRR